MKFKNLEDGTIAKSVFDAGGMLAGGLLSSGIEGVVPIEDSKMRKGIMATIGIVGSAYVKGDGFWSLVGRNLLLGMGIRQGQRFIAEAATPTLPEADGTTMNKFMHDMLETGGGDVIKPTVEARRRMGMGYRFTPNRTTTQVGAHHTNTQPARLEFPLT
jgi:hypothetical protein